MTQLGKYDIIEEIGRGGFGVVYRAMDTGLQVERAIKVLHPALIVEPEMAARFKREAQIAARLEHPNIVPVYDIGEAEGRIYLAMKVMAGGSLKERLAARGALGFDEALDILRQVSEGLDCAHQQGIIHRDLKPGNILFDDQGKMRVSDFGFAKVLSATGATALTMSGGILGTPAYMAPELWNGTPPPSSATDVYALACVFYEMVTGKVLFDGKTPMTVMRKHADGPDFSSTMTLSRNTISVLKKALFENPQERYKKMGAFVQALSQSQERKTADLKAAPIKAPEPVVQKSTVEVKPTRGQQSSSQMGAESSFEKPVVKSSRADREYSKTSTRMEEKKNTKWVLWGGLGIVGVMGVIVIIILIGIGIISMGGGIRPAAEAPVAEQPAEKEEVEITEERIEAHQEEIVQETEELMTEESEEKETEAVEPENNSYQAGDQKTNKKDGAEMVFVPAGEFLMGSRDEDIDWILGQSWCTDCEREWFVNELPEHDVYLDNYWIYKHEVTNAQFAVFLNAEGNQGEGIFTWFDETNKQGKIHLQEGDWAADSEYVEHPVVAVNWYGAQAYCEWAGGRLPTEAEWEKAAKGTDGRTYPWGDTDINGLKANYCDINCDLNWKESNQDDGYKQTAPVGSYPAGASPYGVLDMAGNVWEWVADLYVEDYYSSSPLTNPKGPGSGTDHVLRGGSWYFGVINLHASFRDGADPINAWDFAGFRCVSSP